MITPAWLDVEEVLDRRLRAQEGAAHVDRHHPVEIGDMRLVRLAVDLDAGIVDQHVEAAEQLDHPGEQRIDRVLVGDIGRGEDVDALRIDLGEFVDQRLRRLRGRR